MRCLETFGNLSKQRDGLLDRTLAVWCDVVVQIFPNGVEVAFKYR